jgi:hypothetical protein
MSKEEARKETIVREHSEISVHTPNIDAERISSYVPQEGGQEIRLRLTAESKSKMNKQAFVAVEAPGFSTFSMWCDEGTSLGGEDSAPAPLAYFAAAVAF